MGRRPVANGLGQDMYLAPRRWAGCGEVGTERPSNQWTGVSDGFDRCREVGRRGRRADVEIEPWV